MRCPRTQHPNNIPILKGEKQDFSLKIMHQAGFKTAHQAATLAKRHRQTIVPHPSLSDVFRVEAVFFLVENTFCILQQPMKYLVCKINSYHELHCKSCLITQYNDMFQKLREEILIMKRYFLHCKDALDSKLLLQVSVPQVCIHDLVTIVEPAMSSPSCNTGKVAF